MNKNITYDWTNNLYYRNQKRIKWFYDDPSVAILEGKTRFLYGRTERQWVRLTILPAKWFVKGYS